MSELMRCVTIYPPMLDIVIHTERSSLLEMGLAANTIVGFSENKHCKIRAEVERQIAAGDKHVRFKAGGATFNTQKILSQCMECDFFGIVGEDSNGAIISEQMKGTQVNIHLDKSKQVATPWAYVFISGDERTILAKQDPSASYSAYAKEQIMGRIDQATVFYCVSFTFFLEKVSGVTFEILEQKKEKGFCSILNLSSEEIVGNFKKEILRAAGMCDFIIGNKLEYFELFGATDEARLLVWLDSLKVGYAITDGPSTVYGRIPGGPLRQVTPPYVSDEINTSGAGDSFASGFIRAMKDRTFAATLDIAPLLSEGVRASNAHIRSSG
ncbi:adenosine kinase [Nematocida displodere]|uniref:Adenosine kinase n=1 Tax=Nematocida displodere TaxID=1805483 RepID=A0A177EHT6_9MICR|nr:adenosine kinase [Nematocida displodere]